MFGLAFSKIYEMYENGMGRENSWEMNNLRYVNSVFFGTLNLLLIYKILSH
jgi:hypothetical protein